MRKLVITFLILSYTWVAEAQGSHMDSGTEFEMLKIVATLLFFIIIGVFTITLVKLILDYRLKHKIIENGVPDALAESLLQGHKKNRKVESMKWVLVLTGTGTGLLLMTQFQPLGIHSLFIMAFSLAAGFLAYFLYLKFSKEK